MKQLLQSGTHIAPCFLAPKHQHHHLPSSGIGTHAVKLFQVGTGMLPVNKIHKGKASVFTSVPIICYVDSADGSKRAEQLLHKQPQNSV